MEIKSDKKVALTFLFRTTLIFFCGYVFIELLKLFTPDIEIIAIIKKITFYCCFGLFVWYFGQMVNHFKK